MSDDIVTRLRQGMWRNECCSFESCDGDWYTPLEDNDFLEAADEIERLRAVTSELAALIMPFSLLMTAEEQQKVLKAVRGE